MRRLGVACLLLAMTCFVTLVAGGGWLNVVALVSFSGFIISQDIGLRQANARKDLREVYPPRRDHFHRDLERLNKLRSASVSYKELTDLLARVIIFVGVVVLAAWCVWGLVLFL